MKLGQDQDREDFNLDEVNGSTSSSKFSNKVANSIDIGVKSVFAILTVQSLAFNLSCQHYFGLINGLQIMTLVVLLDLKAPINMQSVYIATLKISNFDIYHTEDLYKEWFEFEDTESWNPLFEEADISGSNFIILMGPTFIAVALFPLFYFYRKVKYYFAYHC